jgi:hypothetical protein
MVDHRPKNAMNVVSAVAQLMAITYFFSCMGIATLRNPTKTLHRNLEYHQWAYRREKLFAEWMIQQVGSLRVVLLEF